MSTNQQAPPARGSLAMFGNVLPSPKLPTTMTESTTKQNDQGKTTTIVPANQQAPPARGLFAMFGKMPSVLATTTGSATAQNKFDGDQASKDNNNNSGIASSSNGGGAWRTVTRRQRKALALKAQQPGTTVTVTASPATVEPEDTDVLMGGTGKRKKRNKRFSPYGSRDQARHVQRKQALMEATPVERVELLVSGFPPGTEMAVVSFLQQKSKKDWEPLEVRIVEGQMLLAVNGAIVANAIIRLNGYIFGTDQLRISLFSEAKPVLSNGVKKETTMDILREFLRSRWNSEAQALNLENIAADPILKRGKIRPLGAASVDAMLGPALMKLAGEMFPNVITISFARNHLKTVHHISTITQFLPNVQNISLEDNLIKTFENLDPISGAGKLKHLRELVLLGNPLRETMIKRSGNDRYYIRNAVKRFPSLVLLDGFPVELSEEEKMTIQRTQSILPLETKSQFFDNEATQGIAFEFLSRYLNLFDTDRSTLRPLYDENATFTLSTWIKMRSASKMSRRKKKKMMDDDNGEVLWTELGRNVPKIVKSNSSKQSGKHLFHGPELICATLCRLPSTVHDLSKTHDFLIDAFQLPFGSSHLLNIFVHGEFKEVEKGIALSFDRTFVLRPSLPDSPALAAGWPYVIVSDILCVRDYCSLSASGTD